MNKICYKSRAIQVVILIIAAILLISLWPVRLINEIVPVSIPLETGTMTQPIDENNTVLQSFVAQYDHLDNIKIYLGEDTTGETFYCRILNEEYTQISEEEVVIDRYNLPGFVTIEEDVDLEVGKMYYMILQGQASVIFAGCENVNLTDLPYAGPLYYADNTVDGMNLVADYNYIQPLRKGKTLLLGAAVLLLMAALLSLVRLFFRKNPEKDKLVTVERVVKWIMNPLAAVLVLVCVVLLFKNYFSTFLLDNTVTFISILLLALILFYGINHDRLGQKPVISMEYIRTHFMDLLQSFFFAGAISGCCEYMAGLYDIHHAVAERKEMIFFCLAVLVMFRLRELFSWYSLGYLVLAGAGGVFWYRSQLTDELQEIDISVIKMTAWIALLLGWIILQLIVNAVKRRYRKPVILYSLLLLVFFALIIIFRNGRWWTVTLAVAFTILYLAYACMEHPERYLTNLLRGVLLQFALATGYCLLHRPFVTYRTARYTHIFHTVTITATYLTVVECAAVVLFLEKFKKSQKLKDFWKEALTLGVVSSYMLFTMARTGYFAVGVMIIFALILMIGLRGKENLIRLLKAAGIMALSLIACVPVVFFAQRTLPALSSDPYVYEIESYPDDILRGRKVNSVEFMRVGRFVDVFAEKILNIPEGTLDLYGEIAEFDATHDVDVSNLSSQMNEELGLQKDLYVTDSTIQLVALDNRAYADEGSSQPGQEDPQSIDYTNGRTDIFKSYIEQLNMTGHSEMGAILKDGSVATHAHDIYLQVAYDHGIPVGIVFILVGFVTFIVSCAYYLRQKKSVNYVKYSAFPAIVTIAFAVAGLVEWIFHLSSPAGFLLMAVLTPLVIQENNKEGKKIEG